MKQELRWVLLQLHEPVKSELAKLLEQGHIGRLHNYIFCPLSQRWNKQKCQNNTFRSVYSFLIHLDSQ